MKHYAYRKLAQILMNIHFRRFLGAASILAMTCTATAALAMDAGSFDLQVSRVGDLDLSCGELAQEAALMKDIILTTQDIRDDSRIKEHGISAGAAAASFLVGTLTGGIGIAAAGFFANEAVESKSEQAESVQDIAEQRRSLMTGIYNAKGCQGPIDKTPQRPPATAQITIHEAKALAQAEPAAGNIPAQRPIPSYND